MTGTEANIAVEAEQPRQVDQPAWPWWLVSCFGFAIFTSAAMIFVVQPMTGKMLLPFVGGVPSGWVVAMAFFQTALLIGYLVAHLCSALSPWRHGLVHLGLLLIAAITLPITLNTHLSPEQVVQQPALTVVLSLTLGVGLPFVALAATGPTLQRLFAANRYGGSRDPYFLYAASNLGSFIGLFAYPLVLEPTLGLDYQSLLWAGIYGLLFVAAIGCVFLVDRTAKAELVRGDTKAAPLPWNTRFLCIATAAIPSSLMLGVTTKITTDIASTPMIWVLPLGLYLLTMIMAFSPRKWISDDLVTVAHPICALAALVSTLQGQASQSLIFMGIHLAAFTAISLSVHYRLAALRPHPSRLTEYFLMLSFGGALGGTVTAFIAPVTLTWYWEYPLALIASLLLLPSIGRNLTWPIKALALALVGLGAWSALAVYLPEGGDTIKTVMMFAIGITMVALTVAPRLLAVALTATVLTTEISFRLDDQTLVQERNFFGILAVRDQSEPKAGTDQLFRVMTHGSTIHGLQLLGELEATTGANETPSLIGYFHPDGPYGDVFRSVKADEVAVMGLGTGALACYQAPGRDFVFYEIDPAVEPLARDYFTFMDQCGNPPVKLGDGRLRLMQDDGPFDLIILDAFSSDAIPVHLMTLEAIEGYQQRLADGGTIAFHISNRFVNLVPTLSAAAEAVGMTGLHIFYEPPPELPLAFAVRFFVMTNNPSVIENFEGAGWTQASNETDTRVWTDQYSNLIGAFMAPLQQ